VKFELLIDKNQLLILEIDFGRDGPVTEKVVIHYFTKSNKYSRVFFNEYSLRILTGIFFFFGNFRREVKRKISINKNVI
jgi:hypothetical protein